MSVRLRVAATLELIRAGWSGPVGIAFAGIAGIAWFSRPSDTVGAILRLLGAGVFGLLGAAFLAIAIPSLAFGLLILTRKRAAKVAVVVGECLIAVALAVVTIYLLMQRGDKGLAIASGAVLMVVSVPVITLLMWDLARPGPKPPAA